MKKKIIKKRVIKTVSLVLVTVLSTLILQEWVLCNANNNRERLKGFYLEKNDTIDVVLIGASDVYCDYSAPYAYEKYGFTSYPVASQGLTAQSYLPAIKEAVRTQHPELIVVEINGFLYNEEQLDNEAYVRDFIDNVPLNETKLEYIDEKITDNKAEYFFPIIKYHPRWRQFPKGLKWNLGIMQDYIKGFSPLKGVKNKTEACSISRDELINFRKGERKKRVELEKVCKDELICMLDYCRQENVNVLFTRFPHAVLKHQVRRFRRVGAVEDIVKEYGFPFVNFDFLIDEIGLDTNADFYNNEHLNVYGQIKFTDYFGKYLVNSCAVKKSELDESVKAEWDESVKYYEAYRKLNDEKFEKGEITSLGGDIKTYMEMKKYF